MEYNVKDNLIYEVDHYEVILQRKNNEKHIFGVEENAFAFALENKDYCPRFLKILNGVLI
jgi:hypothetical protein